MSACGVMGRGGVARTLLAIEDRLDTDCAARQPEEQAWTEMMHDLRSPLTVTGVRVQLLRRHLRRGDTPRRIDADAMCVQCHKDLAERPERHTRHLPQTEASRCVSCHMPRIMEALLFQARTHEIDDIPDAEMTERFGTSDSPNACLTCHHNRNSGWLSAEIAAFRRVN